MHEHVLHIPCVWLQALTAVASFAAGTLIIGAAMWCTLLKFESHWHKQQESR